MSEQETQLGVEPRARSNGDDPLAGSFEARMHQRRVEREQRTTEMFDPPGFEDLFRVEMRVLGYRALADLSLKHQRQRDDAMRSLYLAADQVLAATVAFHLRIEMTRHAHERDPGSRAGSAIALQDAAPSWDEVTRPQRRR